MKKRIVIILILVILVLVLPIFVDAKVEKVSKEILNAADDQKIRVVVHFKEDISQKSIKSLFLSDKIISEDKVRYKTKESVFTTLTKKEIEQLAVSDKIDFISEEKKYRSLLQDSVPLINATPSWNLQSLGINLTGNGQTICIIDTGINYSHPDLGGCFGENNVSSDCKVIGGWNTYSGNAEILDDYGHGTHVAGIAAANGSLNGVALFSKIIMIKANIPAENSFNGADVIEGIDWCINNASKFNITTISMSLGGDTYYSNYCDSYPSEWSDRDAINRAFAKNISVVVASGNENNKTSISSPACVQNATPVTSNNKGDTQISSFANIWSNSSLYILTAPGGDGTFPGQINSTSIDEGYELLQGTSMATPHVAGAIAILNQYLSSVEQTKTPMQIEDLLNATGKQIYDSAAGRYFSRIDVYAALMEIDSTNPNVTLSSPINNSIDANQNQTFICNLSDWQLSNVTFYLWNSTGLYFNETKNITGTTNSTSFNKTGMISGSYLWNCLAYDQKGNSAFATNNYSLSIGGISLSLISPFNVTYTKINETSFNCSATSSPDRQIKNITFSIYENGILGNTSSINLTGIANSSLFNYTFVNETEYIWGCEVYSNNSDSQTKNYTITYDITSPNLTFVSETVSTTEVTIEWDTNEETNYSISLQNLSNASFSENHTLIVSGLSASTIYNYNLTYCDLSGNCNVSEESFTTNANPVVTSSSGGGGGGGGGSTPVKLTESQLSQGYSKSYFTGDKISFLFGGQNHSIQLNRIFNNSVNITIRSEPINLILQKGEEKRINLSSSEYYDLYIKIENVTKYSANITIKQISELINPYNLIKYDNTKENNDSSKGKQYEIFDDTKPQNTNLLSIYALVILLFISAIYFLFKRIFSNKDKDTKNKKK